MHKLFKTSEWFSGVLPILRIRSFTLLWLGQAISMLGDHSQSIGLSVFVFRETGSNLALGVSVVLQIIPTLFLGPIAGVYADRLDKRRLMLVCDFFRGSLAGSLVFVRSLPYLYVVSFLIASASVLFNAARGASIAHIVEENRLAGANSLGSLTSSLIRIFGPVFGGVLVAVAGPACAFGVNALSFLISALFIVPVNLPCSEHDLAKQPFWKSFRQGMSELWGNARLTRFVVLMMLSFFAVGGVQVLFPGFVLGFLKLGSQQLGSIMSFQGMGALVAAISLSLLAGRLAYSTILSLGITGLAIGIGILGLSRTVASASAGIFTAGLALVAVNVGANTAIMRLVPRNRLGRVGGTLESMATGLSLLAMAAAAFLADRVGIPAIFLAIAFVLGGTALYGFLALSRKEHPESGVCVPAGEAADGGATAVSQELQ